MTVRLISITEPKMEGSFTPRTPESLIAYVARVSNPNGQMNDETAPRLLRYLIKHKHWSPFEMAHMTVEIETSRAVAAQILRHRSFSFQELSQRYATGANAIEPEMILHPARRQDVKNRQNSIDDLPAGVKIWFEETQQNINEWALEKYNQAIGFGIAKEQARFLLPMSTKTRLYMCGSARSWIHYIELRTEPATQLEHREVAEKCKSIFCQQFPSIAEALEWQNLSTQETGSAK